VLEGFDAGGLDWRRGAHPGLAEEHECEYGAHQRPEHELQCQDVQPGRGCSRLLEEDAAAVESESRSVEPAFLPPNCCRSM